MSVIRIKKARDKPYVILDKTALNDARLSFRAKGLHTYLMAQPDDWQVHLEQLEKQSPREARDAIRGGMKELEDCGYIRRQRIRGEKGRMMGWDTTVYETPLLASLDAEDERLGGESIGLEDDSSPTTDYPTSDEPTLDQPTSVQPSSDNPTLLINKSTKKIKETNTPLPPKGKRARPVPDEYTPRAPDVTQVEQRYPTLDWRIETEKFRDWDKANGPRWKDHDAAWRLWMRNANGRRDSARRTSAQNQVRN
jgi:hypothetical protein